MGENKRNGWANKNGIGGRYQTEYALDREVAMQHFERLLNGIAKRTVEKQSQ